MADHQPHIDLDELRGALVGRLESLAERLLGDRNRDLSGRSQWRFGNRGSLSLEVRGRKRGTWISHEAEQGGGPLDLIRFTRGISFEDAVQWGADFAGICPVKRDAEEQRRIEAAHRAERERRRLADEAEDAADEVRRISSARRVWGQTMPIAGTVGERYLIGARAIPAPDGQWPDAVRFLPVRTVKLREDGAEVTIKTAGAVVLAATAADGSVVAIQRVYLTDQAENLCRVGGSKIKLTLGAPGAAAARLPGAPDGPLLIAEGPETGLSVWRATGHETWIALGAIGAVDLPPGRLIVICRDDDRAHSPADKALSRALARWRVNKIEPLVATPWPTRRGDKSDFNDLIRADGPEAVRGRLRATLHPHGEPPRRVTVGEGRRVLAGAVTAFFEAVTRWDAEREAMPSPAGPDRDEPPPPDWEWEADDTAPEPPPAAPDVSALPTPVHLVQGDTGAGKSDLVRRQSAVRLAEMRRGGDKRTIAIAVPTHTLGAEQQRKFEALPEAQAAGLTCRIWRGRRADDPDAPGEKMCRNIELVREVQGLKLDVEKRACGICPFKADCAYLGQRRLRADLWFVAHQMLFEMKPKALGDLAMVIVDENPIGCALDGVEREGAGHRPPLLPFEVLARVDLIEGAGGMVATDRLMFLRRAARDILGDHADGPIHRVVFDDGLITAAGAREAGVLEWRTRIDVELTADMSRDERAAALEAAACNADLGRRVAFWRALAALLDNGPEASGWAAMGGGADGGADPLARHVDLKGRRDIGKRWRVPTLVLDATAKPELLRYLWPDLVVTADVRMTAPHQTTRQTTDSGFALSRLDVDGAKDDDERRHRQRNLRNLHAVICREARRFAPGSVLVVAQQRVEKALLGLGHLPGNVSLEHHNAVRGLDEYRDARALIVVGRTMPASSSIARMLEALTGAAAPTADYEKGEAVRELADGTMRTCETWHFPHPIGEALRWGACEAEVVQIIGRGRAVNRTAATPLDVLVLTDVPLPLPIQPIAKADLDPTPGDLMAAAGAIVFENPGHAADAYPGLWASRDTAKKALQRSERGQMGTNPYKESTSYTGMSPSGIWSRVEYQRAGARQSSAVAWFDRSLVPDPEGALSALLGPLAWCRVHEAEPVVADSPVRVAEGGCPEVPGCVPLADPGSLYPVVPATTVTPPDDRLAIHLPGGDRLYIGDDQADRRMLTWLRVTTVAPINREGFAILPSPIAPLPPEHRPSLG